MFVSLVINCYLYRGKFLHSAVSNPDQGDWSRCIALYSLANLFNQSINQYLSQTTNQYISQTINQSIIFRLYWEASSHAEINARRLFVHKIFNKYYRSSYSYKLSELWQCRLNELVYSSTRQHRNSNLGSLSCLVYFLSVIILSHNFLPRPVCNPRWSELPSRSLCDAPGDWV